MIEEKHRPFGDIYILSSQWKFRCLYGISIRTEYVKCCLLQGIIEAVCVLQLPAGFGSGCCQQNI